MALPRSGVKKGGLSYYRPTGQPDPDPQELAQARLDLADLQQQAEQGNIILLYQDETILWRFAIPRAGWWHTANRHRLDTGALSGRQVKHQEALKRQAWQQCRSWSRIRSGVLLSVIGAVQYGTSKVFWKVVPHFDTYEFRAKALQSTLQHYQGRFRLHLLPARAGHHLNPIEGFWRVMKDTIAAGRCFDDLHHLYQRTRRVLLRHQQQAIYHFAWSQITPRI